ncbi:MAG: peptidyl-prolyl cis-trans isomerase [bacterium]
MIKSTVKFTAAIALILVLGGCKPLMDLFKKKEAVKEKSAIILVQKDADNSTVLLNIDGKAAITESDFNKHLTQMLQVNPYFRGASVDSLPGQLKRKFFDELIKQELIIAWANKNNIDQDEEFKKSYEEMKNLVKRSLLVQRFETKLFEDVKVSEKEVKDYFDNNKDKFIKEPGGVTVEGVSFDDDANATEFLNSVKGKEAEFKTIAKADSKGTFKSFGRIEDKQAGAGANIPKVIKDKAASFTKFPAVGKVQVEGKIWVICASDKKETTYFELAEIKDQLEGMLKNNMFREILDKKIETLKSGFTVDVNEDFFQEAAPAFQPGVEEEIDIEEIDSPSSAA